ncbi:hypothetical protein, partial [Phocaeicola sp.]|uniref:hypothetical protein n=1 Tax=Phocaeicola sp. TaxID=2773926 RepID=UPI003A8E560E
VILIHSAKVLLLDNHVSFGNIVFGLASAQHSTGFVGCASYCSENLSVGAEKNIFSTSHTKLVFYHS